MVCFEWDPRSLWTPLAPVVVTVRRLFHELLDEVELELRDLVELTPRIHASSTLPPCMSSTA